VLSVKTRHVKHWVAYALRLAAQSLSRSQSGSRGVLPAPAGQTRRPKAITATAHKLARIVYHLLTTRQPYEESASRPRKPTTGAGPSPDSAHRPGTRVPVGAGHRAISFLKGCCKRPICSVGPPCHSLRRTSSTPDPADWVPRPRVPICRMGDAALHLVFLSGLRENSAFPQAC